MTEMLIEKLVTDSQWIRIQKLYRKRYGITPRELQIMHLICAGLKDEEIASQLRIRTGTVQTHKKNIYRRMGLHGGKIHILLRVLNDLAQILEN